MHVGTEDYLLANRRAARSEEIALHGKPVSFRGAVHKPKKAYLRCRMKRQAEKEACLAFFYGRHEIRLLRA